MAKNSPEVKEQQDKKLEFFCDQFVRARRAIRATGHQQFMESTDRRAQQRLVDIYRGRILNHLAGD